MSSFTKYLTLALALAATPLWAQEATAPEAPADEAAQTEAPAADAAPEAATEGAGEPYVAENFDTWELRCLRAKEGADPCQLYQLLKDKGTDKPIAEISLLALPEGSEAAAGATVIMPLETLLTKQLSISIDGGQAKRYPFTFCAEVGCVARVGFTKEDLDGFRKGKVAVLSVVPVADPSRTVDIELSLSGFTAGFEAVTKANAPQ